MSSPAFSTPQQVTDALEYRYATKTFDPSRIIAPAQWASLEQSLILSPSSFGLQPWRFIVVANPAVRANLRAAAWNQSQVTDASHLVVFAAKLDMPQAHVDRFLALTAEVRRIDVAKLSGYRQMILGFTNNPEMPKLPWNTRQVYLALGFFMFAAAAQGIDTCPLEGIDPPRFDEVLGLQAEGFTSVVACAAGYRAVDDKSQPSISPKVRFDASEIVRHVR